ncbi:MAG: M48 family metallopeptidase [Nitrospiraceae bacterium]
MKQLVMLCLIIAAAGCTGLRERVFNGGFGAAPSTDSATMYGNRDTGISTWYKNPIIPEFAPEYSRPPTVSYAGDWQAVANVARPLTFTEQRRIGQLQSVMQRYLPLVQNLDSYKRVYAADQQEMNAFASGDSIIVFNGLFNVVDSEDELAVIIGHEIGHIVLQHVTGWNGRNTSRVLGQLGDIALCLSQQICDQTASALMQPVTWMFSRDQEREADDFGFSLLCRAGYNPHAVVSVWETMSAKMPENNGWSFLRSHPSNIERLNTLSAKVASCPRKQVQTPASPVKKLQKIPKDKRNAK